MSTEPEVIPCQRTIGAQIRGIDLQRPVSDADFSVLYEALLQYKVIFFRDQHLTTEQHVAFAKQFGPLEQNPFRPQRADIPELQIIKNDKNNPVLSTDVWHADLTFREYPTKFTVLRCLQIPDLGGDTMWADMCAAYDGLSPKLREFITGLTATHDFKNFRVLYKGDAEKRSQLLQMEEMFPNVSHPVVITHPETGQRVLFVNRQFTLRLDGMSELESRNLLEILYHQSSVPEYQFRLNWKPGTLVVWDNRHCQHYAVNDYYPHPRHMERVAVAGDARPRFDPEARLAREYGKVARVHAHEGLH